MSWLSSVNNSNGERMDQASEMKLSEPLIDYLVSRNTKEGQSAFYGTQWQKRTLCLIVALMALTLVVAAWLFIGRFWMQ